MSRKATDLRRLAELWRELAGLGDRRKRAQRLAWAERLERMAQQDDNPQDPLAALLATINVLEVKAVELRARAKATAVHSEMAQQSAAELRLFSQTTFARHGPPRPPRIETQAIESCRGRAAAWRVKAAELRAKLPQIHDDALRRILGAQADAYDRLSSELTDAAKRAQENADLRLRVAANVGIARQIADELRINTERTAELLDKLR